MEQEQEFELAASEGNALVHALLQAQADIVFGHTGGSDDPLIAGALYRCAAIRHIAMRQEQAAVHAADGYARATGKPGVVLLQGGGSAANAVTAIATAYMDSIPLVIIAGQGQEELVRYDYQQPQDGYPLGIPVGITKASLVAALPEELPQLIRQAFELAACGRPGPVLVSLPTLPTLRARSDRSGTPLPPPSPPPHSNRRREAAKLDAALIDRIASLIYKAKKPLLVCGGGVLSSDASQMLIDIAETARIPIVTTLMGISACPARHPLYYGMAGLHGIASANKAVQQADLLICLGIRFSDRMTGNSRSFSPESYKIQIDIDREELNRIIPVDLPIDGDIKAVLSALKPVLVGGDTEPWLAELAKRHKKEKAVSPSYNVLRPHNVIKLIDRATGGDAIIAADVGPYQRWAANGCGFNRPRSLLTSGGIGTMGYAFPAAIGAAVAAPQRQVVCISGDDNFQVNLQEMLTAVDCRLPLKIVLLHSGKSASRPSMPDYIKYAQAYGALGLKARTYNKAKDMIRYAFSTPGLVLMEFEVSEDIRDLHSQR